MKSPAVASRRWMVLSLSLAVAACGGGGGGGNEAGVPAPPPGAGAPPLVSGGGSGSNTPAPPSAPASSFAGNFDVTYQGSEQGSCSVQILGSGGITGKCVNEAGATETLSGDVKTNGDFLSTLGNTTSGRVTFKGVLTTQQTGTGDWTDNQGKVGTWALKAPAVPITALPSLAAPQAGSLAATGNGLFGVWSNLTDPDAVAYAPLVLSESSQLYFVKGGYTVRGGFTTSLNGTSGTFNLDTGGGFPGYGFTDIMKEALRGNASFGIYRSSASTANSLGLSCYRVAGGLPNDLCDYQPSKYDVANALSVNAADLTGEWTGPAAPTFRVDTAGNLTVLTAGTVYGDCQITGTLTQPNASKNLFDVTLPSGAVTGGADCKLLTASATSTAANAAYTGVAFVRVVNEGSAALPFYKQRLDLYVSQSPSDAGVPHNVVLKSTRR